MGDTHRVDAVAQESNGETSEITDRPRWLVVAEEEFVPADSGGRVESLNLLGAITDAGIDVHVLVPGMTPASEPAHRAAVPGVVIEPLPRRTGITSHLSLRPFVFTSRPLPAGHLERLTRLHARRPFTTVVGISFRVAHLGMRLAEVLDLPLLVRPQNIESRYFAELARSAGFPTSLAYRAEAWKLRRAERAVHAGDRVGVFADIAEADARLRAELTGRPVLHVPPFLPRRAASAAPAPAQGREGVTVLFLGSLDNDNNLGALRWFLQQCWPIGRGRTGRARFQVVGRRAPDGLDAQLREAGAELAADVPDVAPYLAAAGVFVNPVTGGSGVNIKMVDAMAAGLPVVTTSVGARGVGWRDGEHLLVRDDAAGFAAAVAQLTEDPARRQALGAAGRQFVEAELDGRRSVGRLRAALEQVQLSSR